jgi:hypothetical protein
MAILRRCGVEEAALRFPHQRTANDRAQGAMLSLSHVLEDLSLLRAHPHADKSRKFHVILLFPQSWRGFAPRDV